MPDLYFSEDGDLKTSVSGDVAITYSESRNLAQQIYLRVMTVLGDFPLYPNMGAEIEKLIGMPQTKETGTLGEKIIMEALDRDGRLKNRPISVKAVPVSAKTIRFDIYTIIDNKRSLVLSVEQDLGVI